MLDLLAGFIQELRAAGLPVSLTENLDAMEAVRHIPLEDREAFKYALGATLVKNNAHWGRSRRSSRCTSRCAATSTSIDDDADDDDDDRTSLLEQLMGEAQQGGGAHGGLTPEELAEMLYKALMNGDEAMLRALARQAVTRFAGMEPGRPVGGTYYLYRTLRNLDLDGMLER